MYKKKTYKNINTNAFVNPIESIVQNEAVEMWQNEQSLKTTKRLQLADIPFELMLSTCEFLDLNSLANVAQTSRFNQKAAETIYKIRYSSNRFTINGHTALYDRYSTDLNQFDKLLNIIATFGHLITKLSLDYYTFGEEQKEAINRQFSKYAARSLIEIDLRHSHEKDFFGLSGPFKRAKIVRLRDGLVGAIFHTNFRELFPAVVSLDIESMLFVAETCVEHHFPHLKEFKMEALTMASTKLEQRLQLNPQLRKLSITGGNLDSLNLISKNVPKLEHLDYRGFYGRLVYRGDKIHFERLKTFRISINAEFPEHFDAIPIVFDKLEEFSCDGSYNKWLDIIVKSENLKKISFGQFNDEHLQRIARKLPGLKEISIENERESDVNVDNVIQFIEMCKQLKRFTIARCCVDVCKARAVNLTKWEFTAVNKSVVFVRNECDDIGNTCLQ